MCVYHGVDQIRRITIQLYSNSKNFVRRYCSIVNLFVCSTRESGSGCSILIEYSFVSPRVSPKIIKFTFRYSVERTKLVDVLFHRREKRKRALRKVSHLSSHLLKRRIIPSRKLEKIRRESHIRRAKLSSV